MNKPKWEIAPSWANFMAMDEDGSWWWFETEPRKAGNGWNFGGKSMLVCTAWPEWDDTLERRP